MLTKREVDSLRWDPAKGTMQVKFDDSLPGFGLRVYPTGAKAFVLRYGMPGRRRTLMTLGAYGVLTLDQARKRAREELLKVGTGEDPAQGRRDARAASTVSDLCDVFLERHAKPRLRTCKEVERQLTKQIKPALGHLPVGAVTRADVAALHVKIGATAPIAANRALSTLHKMFELATVWGLLEEDRPNPAGRIERYPETSRERWVTPQEMPKLAKAIEAEPNLYIRAVLWILLTTGLRKSEALSLRWEEVDLKRAEIRLTRTKNNRPRTVPLSPAAAALLQDLPRMLRNPHVFPGHRLGSHLANIQKSWDAIRAAAGLRDVRLHDLRRTAGSWMASAGVGTAIIGKALGHLTPAATAIYARVAEDSVRKALDEHGERMAAFMGRQA